MLLTAPRKRRKLETNAVAYGDVLADLDFEFLLRARMADTIESRISWALILQESLEKGVSAATPSFGHFIFDALSAIEEPTEALVSRRSPPRSQLNTFQVTKTIRLPSKQIGATAKNPNKKFLYIRSTDLNPPCDTSHVQTYLLRCPTCSRQAFTSLQGLLNHARISHNTEWGTHDECVRACAVVDPDIDLEAGIEVGLGPTGILPGLRSLFQMAVGAHRPQEFEATTTNGAIGNTLPSEYDTTSHLTRTLGLHQDTPALAPFLGKQAVRRGISIWDMGDELVDIVTIGKESNLSPACPSKIKWRMPYKHRNSVVSSANIMEVGPVDLTAEDRSNPLSLMMTNGQSGKPFIPSAESDTRSGDVAAIRTNFESTELASGASSLTSGSRFHFTTRVVLTDRSLWIPPDRRQEIDGHTHKWMLSIESPSYSRNITTILQHLRVTSLSDPPQVLTKSEPPFAVVGTTDQPFLATVELVFSGASYSNRQTDSQTIILEHWVELDLLKSANGAIGDEQVVDIELDKGTILMPARSTNVELGSKALWNVGPGQSAPVRTANQNRPASGGSGHPSSGYSRILLSLVQKFPMTQKDIKNTRPPNSTLPYKLVGTPAQLKSLVYGRRKAIEWGRARALQHAYTREGEVNSLKYARDTFIPLTTGDVFAWLNEQGHFLRPPSSLPKSNEEVSQALTLDKPAQIWCSVCGQDVEAHLAVKKGTADPRSKDTVKAEDTTRLPKSMKLKSGRTPNHTIPIPCNIVPIELQMTKLPIISMEASIISNRNSWQYNNINSQASGSTTKPRTTKVCHLTTIVSAVPPVLTLAVRKLITALNLPTFNAESFDLFYGNERFQYTPGVYATQRSQVERHLASYAIIALATKQFIRILIEGALESSKREKAAAEGSSIRRKRKVTQEKNETMRLLTPVHVLSIMTRVQGQSGGYHELDVAIAGCLTKLGVLAERYNDIEGLIVRGKESAKDVNDAEGSSIKLEQL